MTMTETLVTDMVTQDKSDTTEEEYPLQTTCVADEDQGATTRPILPEIPAQLSKIYQRVLRAVGMERSEPVMAKSNRCIPNGVTQIPGTGGGGGTEFTPDVDSRKEERRDEKVDGVKPGWNGYNK